MTKTIDLLQTLNTLGHDPSAWTPGQHAQAREVVDGLRENLPHEKWIMRGIVKSALDPFEKALANKDAGNHSPPTLGGRKR